MSSMYPSFGGTAVRPCMRCGAPLALNESQCSRCGTFNPLPQGQQPGMFQQGQQITSSGPSWGAQSPQAQQFPQNGGGAWSDNTGSSSPWGSTGQAGGWPQTQNTLFPGQNQPPSQPLQNNLFGNNGAGFFGQNQAAQNNPFANVPQSPSTNNFFAATQQKGYGTSPLGMANGANRRGYQPEENQGKKRPGAAMVALVIVLLAGIIVGGGYAGYKFLNRHAPTTSGTPTAPAIVTPTGAPQFSDFFKDNSQQWNANAPTGTKFSLANGKMTLEADSHPLLYPLLLPGNKTFADFRLDVDAALAKGDNQNGYGVYIRAASTPDSSLGLYYRFEVYGDGSFVIYKGAADPKTGNSVSNSLKSSNTPNNAVYTDGHLNHLTIIAKGTQLSFLINGTNVSTFTDPDYKSGAIALFVSSLQKSTVNAQATFANLAIFPAQ